MNTETLRLFLEVARVGSFAAVARLRDIDPSSVSRAVALLEDDLGVRLFQRSTRRMELTEAGDRFRSRLGPILDELAQAQDEAAQLNSEPAGLVRMSASVAFGHTLIVPLLDAFHASFPLLQMDLILTDSNLDLIAERIDIAIRLGAAIDANLIASKLLTTRYRVVASPDWRDRHPDLKSPADLADLPCLRFNLPMFRDEWLFRDPSGIVTTVPIHGSFTISSVLALRDAAQRGLGPALLADWLIDRDVDGGGLVDLFPEYDAAATGFDTAAWIIYPSRAFLPRKVRVTVDFFRQAIQKERRAVAKGS